ncbi:MAG: N-acetyltransferase, partial [Acetobacteraceae bacterium]|nr:N-acetyltransferase [Acetobacteraceae bacterium]
MDDGGGLTFQLAAGIDAFAAAEWDGCAGAANPFVRHGFLAALEQSGSVGARTGWLVRHASLRDGAGRLVGCAPMYVKAHSHGEYVFDHAWANALARAGGSYYPKLLVAVPFSPVPGPRLLVREGIEPAPLRRAMATALAECSGALGCSSVHVTFCTEAEQDACAEAGWLRRIGVQFHWHNAGYRDFQDFLDTLSSRKRKAIRKERQHAREGLEVRTLVGAEISARHWKKFHQFYLATVDKRWGHAYLAEKFWPRMAEAVGEAVVLMVAERRGEMVAAALNLQGSDTLFGRNWGAAIDQPYLHFELCYYMAIEHAIAHSLSRVEAGAQGEHKIARGYLPVKTTSAHHILHPGLAEAVADFLARER